MINKKSSFSKIILAVDVDDQSVKPATSVWQVLGFWSKKLNVEIEAVHVLQNSPRLIDDVMKNTAANSLHKFIHRAGVDQLHLSDGTVLAGGASLSSSIASLLQYAKKQNAKMLMVMSHGRRGVGRFMMGSFSEKLLKTSLFPVVFLGKTGLSHRSRFLFITDFSTESKRSFQLFLAQFKELKPEVVVYHAIQPMYELMGVVQLPTFEQRSGATDKMVGWIKLAGDSGVSARSVIEENVLSIPKAVQKLVIKENIAMIGFSSHLGRIAKEIFRLHPVTVWVCGPALMRGAMNKMAIKPAPIYLKASVHKKEIGHITRM